MGIPFAGRELRDRAGESLPARVAAGCRTRRRSAGYSARRLHRGSRKVPASLRQVANWGNAGDDHRPWLCSMLSALFRFSSAAASPG